jgi:hypothetical protein
MVPCLTPHQPPLPPARILLTLPVVTAMKHGAKLAMSIWQVYKACGVRDYDLEYFLARLEAREEELPELSGASEYIRREYSLLQYDSQCWQAHLLHST